MTKHSEVTATFRPNAEEVFQVTVVAANAYPDGLRQARTEAVAGVRDLVANALELYREPVTPDAQQ